MAVIRLDQVTQLAVQLAERTTADLVAMLADKSLRLAPHERAAIKRVLRLRRFPQRRTLRSMSD